MELSGILWLLSIVLGQVSCVVGAFLYSVYYHGPGKVQDATVFSIVGALLFTTAAAGCGLLAVMNPEYRRTFFSPITGWQYSLAHFMDHEGADEIRVGIFAVDAHLWRPIRHQVKAWVLESHEAWKQTVWFTPIVQSRIPEDFLAKEVLVDVAYITHTPGESDSPFTALGELGDGEPTPRRVASEPVRPPVPKARGAKKPPTRRRISGVV
jgi:hypothetical protein